MKIPNSKGRQNSKQYKDISMEQTFTDANFETEVLRASSPVFVDFWAAWCGPCKLMSPIVEELAEELSGTVIVGKMNVDEHPQTAQSFGIMSIPTFLLFKHGQVAEQMVGTMSKDAMRERIMKHL
jgi:thioredoxin 1